MHELIHLALHRKEASRPLSCYEKNIPSQNATLEWQANEGAAEFLLPAALFIPDVTTLIEKCQISHIEQIKKILSERFYVSKCVIEVRLESLKYEIFQYAKGIPLHQIEVLSHHVQSSKGIHILSINEIQKQIQTCFNVDSSKSINYSLSA